MFLKYCSLEGNSFWRIFTTKLVRIVLLATYKKCAWCSQTNLLFLPHNSFVLKFHSISHLLSISHFFVEVYLQHKSQHPLQSPHSDLQCSRDHQCQNHLTMRAPHITVQSTGYLSTLPRPPPSPPCSELKIDKLSLTNVYIPRVVLLFVHILVADRRFPEDFKPEVKHKRRGR